MTNGTVTAVTGNGNGKTWLERISQYGFAAVLCGAVLWFVGYKMVLPNQAKVHDAMDRIMLVNEKNADTRAKEAENNMKIANALVEQTSYIKQIRDDQRAGVWQSKGHP